MKDDLTRKIEAVRMVVDRVMGPCNQVTAVEYSGDWLANGRPARHIEVLMSTSVDGDRIEKLCEAFCTKDYSICSTPNKYEICLMLFGVTFPWEL